MKAGLLNARRSVAQKFLTIFCRADSAHPAEHSSEMLLRFEAAGHRDVQDARLAARKNSFARSIL
jgi:hypothetical protein